MHYYIYFRYIYNILLLFKIIEPSLIQYVNMKKQTYVSNKRSCLYKKSTKTLDHCHKETLSEFENDKMSVDTLKAEISELSKELSEIESIPNSEKSDENFSRIVHINDNLRDKRNKINQIETNNDEIEYYIKTSHILYNYYDLIENNNDSKLNIKSELDNPTIPTNSTTKSILSYFHEHRSSSDFNEKSIDKKENTTDTQEDQPPKNRAVLLNQYLAITDVNYINDNINNINASKCVHCNSTEKVILVNDNISYCNECYAVEHILTDNEKPSYKDPPKEISYFSYKRINHYQEWLNQIQGKETTDIPESVFDQIMLELKKQRITNTKDLTGKKIKEILKKLKINKYYEHIPYIMNRITGVPNPNLSPELEETLRNMFKEIQVPFLKHAPLVRKNFLSYSYVIHKFIQILDKPEYLKFFPLLKSREKLHQQEEIWKKICKDLNWKFIRSI